MRQSRFPNDYWSTLKRLLVWGSNDCSFRIRTNRAGCRESCPLCRVLRHRTPSSPICIPEVIRKPFALSQVLLLSSGGKCAILVKKKASSRSGILLSMHVVLKTRHANPNITYGDIRATYVAQTYLPLVRNFYLCAEQQPIAITTKCAVVNKSLL